MEPIINVGILSGKTIRFALNGVYRCGGVPVEGEQEASLCEGQVKWQGQTQCELLFETTDDASSFVLHDVVIGIGFHWQRREDQRFRGSLRLIVEGDRLTAVNRVGTEEYLTSVIASEMSASASLELLRAHAVISRSWLLAQIERQKAPADALHKTETAARPGERIRWYDREDHTRYDVCADDHCQRYQGITRTFGHIDRVREAIDSTRGEVLTHAGKMCDARFSKCCGGVVEEFQNCWEDTPLPYLKAVRDTADDPSLPHLTGEGEATAWIAARPEAFCNTTDRRILSQVLNGYDRETTDFYRWQVTYTQAEVTDLVRRRGDIDVGEVTDLVPLERGASGRIVRLLIRGTAGDFVIGKELEIRRTLSESHLYSSAFYVERTGGTFTLHGAGWGHGVGLCQIGAAVMGERGYRYDEILKHYYPGADIRKMY